MHCKRTGESEYDLTKTKNIITYEALAVPLKKKLKTFYHFCRHSLYFPDFFQVWKIAG